MKILLFGRIGQVGWELNRSLQPLGEIVVLDQEDADFSDPESLRDVVREIKPDVIVNAVAYTAVDKAEQEEELVEKINGVASGVLAEEASNINALLVHYSTDYVFDGTQGPYAETDSPNPLNAYGRTKLAGEQAIQSSACDYLIMRTSWVYASRAHNFLLTILKLAKEREELSIVADQIGSPTSARLIAETTILCIQQAMIERDNGVFSSGLYHLTSSGSTSWHGFAEQIVEMANQKLDLELKIKQIKAIPTTDYPTPAQRPMNSQLVVTKLEKKFGLVMPHWKDMLALCVEEIK
ncbi:MAG: dTDP-4-dehydrorhamnose reductase [Gammaproteobacteria bacterium]|nr:dTDP-4-dehydrorhamnose reductase [Gammaproteobacteria bacterium]